MNSHMYIVYVSVKSPLPFSHTFSSTNTPSPLPPPPNPQPPPPNPLPPTPPTSPPHLLYMHIIPFYFMLTADHPTDHPNYASWSPLRGRLALFENLLRGIDTIVINTACVQEPSTTIDSSNTTELSTTTYPSIGTEPSTTLLRSTDPSIPTELSTMTAYRLDSVAVGIATNVYTPSVSGVSNTRTSGVSNTRTSGVSNTSTSGVSYTRTSGVQPLSSTSGVAPVLLPAPLGTQGVICDPGTTPAGTNTAPAGTNTTPAGTVSDVTLLKGTKVLEEGLQMAEPALLQTLKPSLEPSLLQTLKPSFQEPSLLQTLKPSFQPVYDVHAALEDVMVGARTFLPMIR